MSIIDGVPYYKVRILNMDGNIYGSESDSTLVRVIPRVGEELRTVTERMGYRIQRVVYHTLGSSNVDADLYCTPSDEQPGRREPIH